MGRDGFLPLALGFVVDQSEVSVSNNFPPYQIMSPKPLLSCQAI